MTKTVPLVTALLIVAIVILIGTVLLRGRTPPAAGSAPTVAAEPDSGLARAMTFATPAEPRK